MKGKNFILLCLIIFILSIAAVSASQDTNQTLSTTNTESHETDIVSVSEDTNQTLSTTNTESHETDIVSLSNEKSSYNNQILAQSENDDILGEDDVWFINSSQSGGNGKTPHTAFKSLKDALEHSGAYTARFNIAPGLYTGSDNVNLTTSKWHITLAKYGDGEVIFDGEGKSRIITFNSCDDIVIDGITFKNGKADEGGAILIKYNIKNSNINAIFINNTAKDGGAIKIERNIGNSKINGIYINNTATGTEANGGGAIKIGGNATNIQVNGIYINNTNPADQSRGGANYFQGEVTNSNITGTYINNSATYGAANYFYNVPVTYTKINGTYINNKAARGTIYLSISENVAITGIYINNSAPEEFGGIINNHMAKGNVEVKNAIFINNHCQNIIYCDIQTVKADNNWFGNTAANYRNRPSNNKVTMNTWLYLNGTKNTNQITQKSDVKFYLMSYNSESGATTSYDNTLLPKVNLTITSHDSKLEKNHALLNEEIGYRIIDNMDPLISAQLENVIYTIGTKKGDFYLLQELIDNTAENSTINLERDYIYNELDTITEGITITKNITINGNGYVIDANGKTRIFNVTAGSINITDVTLKNGNSKNGGAIYFANAISNSNINATFIRNTADYGGTFYLLDAANSNITGTYINNTATDYGIINIMGTASNVNIANAIFLNNLCENVIYAENTGVTANNNWFGNNQTNYKERPKVNDKVTMDAWLFLNGITNQDTVKFLLISYNKTTGKTSKYDNKLLPEVNLTLSAINTTLDKDYASLNEKIGYTPSKSIEITAQIENAKYTIEIKGDFNQLQELINNAAENSVINLTRNYTYNELDTIVTGVLINNNLTINGNGHTIDAKGKTRVFDIQASYVTIENLTIKNANSTNNGGAIYFRQSGRVMNCNFTDNTADSSGGAIEFYGPGNVTNCNFVNNTSNMGGAIYFSSPSSIGIFENCNFTDNTATNGGAIEFHGTGNVTNCNFINNTATYGKGGAIWMETGTVKNCNFINNTADDDDGGAIWMETGTVKNCNFINNTASNRGGAIMLHGAGEVINSKFINNFAGEGIVYVYFEYYSYIVKINNNIFLDKNVNEIIFYQSDSNTSAEYNWFGNNATNYNAVPKTKNIAINNWLFLNATADSTSISILKSYDIVFKLYLYNSTGTFDYDNTKLPAVDLELTAENGTISKNTARLEEHIAYTATEGETGSVTASIGNAVYTIKLNNVKVNPNLSIDPQEVNYSNNTNIALNYNVSATGTVNITLNGKKFNYTLIDVELNASISLGNINADEYDVAVKYSGDKAFVNASANGTLKVNKVNSTLTVESIELDYGKNTTVNVTTQGATGIITKIDGNNASVNNYTIMIPILDAGNHTLTVTTITDTNHNSVTKTANITVNKVDSTLTVNDIVFDYNSTGFSAISYTGATGVTAYVISQPEAVVNVKNDTITVSNLNAGNYKLNVTTTADKNHNRITKTVNVTAKKINSTVNVNDTSIDYGKTTNVTVITEGAIGITAKIDDKNATVKGNTIMIPILDTGTHTLTVTTITDANHNPVTKTAKITINKVDSTLNFETPVWDWGTSLNVTVNTTGATGITAKISDKNLKVDGFVIIMPDDLDAGPYTMTVTTIPDKNHNVANRTALIWVNHVNSTLDVSDVNIEYGTTANVTATTTGATGITAKIGDKYVKVDGFTIEIPVLAVGNYTLTVITVPDENHNAVTKNATVTVRKPDSTLTVPDITFDYKGSGSANVSFTGATSVVAEVVNQSKAVVNVDSNKITVSNLDAGTYTLKVTTIPDDNHSSVTKTASITVNKLKTKITAKAITATYNVNKNLVITLKDAKGRSLSSVKVTVKIKTSKTYTTDKNGQIKVSTKGLVPKKYTAKITFKGDSNYVKSTKNVKVTVKKAKPKIVAKKKTFKKTTKTKKYTVKLKNNKGKAIKKVKLTLKVKGKTYKAKTNKKGKATFKITKLTKKGKFTAKIKFKGNKYYKKATKKVKIKVK